MHRFNLRSLYPAGWLALAIIWPERVTAALSAADHARLPASLRVVLENTQPLTLPRAGRLPLLVLPISQSLAGVDDAPTEETLRELDRRGIGYSVDWNPDVPASLPEALRIAAIQQRLGMETVANATSCLTSFFDGTDAMLHLDDAGKPFAETSFGPKLGCPFTLEPRIPAMAARVRKFVRAYKDAGYPLSLVFADWEIDGPIEWNDAWATSKRCRRCREHLTRLDDFREFQRRLRDLRSRLQREALSEPVRHEFPGALVGNYGVNPHDGWRYWYDYFERPPTDPAIPVRVDQNARYRPWAPEFPDTGFTFANPVVYTWYPIWNWYDAWVDGDYRWFYNLLLEGSSAGRRTPAHVPLVPFVHWTTTAPPDKPDPAVRQFDAARYQELLWHLLLRGHDTFFLWCMPNELAAEIKLLHPVYAESLAHRAFLDRGEPIAFAVPEKPAPVISGLRLGSHVLLRRTNFGTNSGPVTVPLGDGRTLEVPSTAGIQVLELPARATGVPGFRPASAPSTARTDDGTVNATGALRDARNQPRFPLGFYHLPPRDVDLAALARAGVNLVRCQSPADLDRAQAAGLLGWLPVNVLAGPGPALDAQITNAMHHPALAVWEGPDELVWNFTAYSGLQKSAGFTRADWQNQTDRAVAYAASASTEQLPRLRAAIARLRALDPHHRPFWLNEAADSDAAYVRDYLDDIDVTGCDYYPVRSSGTDLPGVGRATDRWRAIGIDRPVWMVLQAFSWHALHPERARRYPSFAESRFMAFDALLHGARGLLYWGAETIDDPAFHASLLALTAEVATLEPWLLGEPLAGCTVGVIDEVTDPPAPQIRAAVFFRPDHGTHLVIVANEDSHRHLGIELGGLDAVGLDDVRLRSTEGNEITEVRRGRCIVRLQGHAVKVFTTDPTLAVPPSPGRNYPPAAAAQPR